MKKISKLVVIAACNFFLASSSWALISNNSCSSGNAKSSGCQGENEVGGPAANDASCCAKAIAKPTGLMDRSQLTALPTGLANTKGDKGTVIDINTASAQDLIILMKTSPQTAQAIVAERSKGAFKTSEDFAARICTQHSIDSGFESSVKIQNEIHEPRASKPPKDAGWKCAAGHGTYEASGRKHNYVGHVILMR